MQVIRPEIKGRRRIEYTTKDQRKVAGYEYHFSFETDNVDGLSCANAFFSDNEMGGAVFEIGDIFTLAYDPYNKSKRYSFLPL